MYRKYRRSLTVEAVQFSGDEDLSAFAVDLYNGTGSTLNLFDCGGIISVPPGCGIIRTLDGTSLVYPGDYIVKDKDGSRFPYKASIFEQLYVEA